MALQPTSIRPAVAVVIVLGAMLLVVALIDLAGAPVRAHRAFDTLVQAQGSLSHSPTYPDTYRSLAAQAIYLRAALLGGAGVALLGVGTAALLRDGGGSASVRQGAGLSAAPPGATGASVQTYRIRTVMPPSTTSS